MASPTPLRNDLLARLAKGAPTTVWTPADFLDLGGREAVDKALQRLVASGDLRRIDRGLYDRPASNRLTGRPNPPDPRAVIDAVARRDQIRVLVDGLTAANDLGLTDAVPARIVVHADARLKPIRLGALEITFQPTAASKLYWAGRPAMRLVQALHWLKDMVARDEDGALKRRVARLLSKSTPSGDLRSDLESGLPTLPAWMQAYLKPLLQPSPAAAAAEEA